jgi:type VI secretion system protein ImpC
MADKKETSAVEGTPEWGILETMLKDEKLARDASQETRAKELFSLFLTDVLNETFVTGFVEDENAKVRKHEAEELSRDNLGPRLIVEKIREIDELISAQMNEILHHPSFQQLEASCRGLRYLVFNSETGSSLKLRLFNASKDELRKDFDKAVEFDQTALFKKVYEEEYGTFGGHPFSCLIGDYYFGPTAPDMKLLEGLSNVAAAAHAPFIGAAAPTLFDMERFTELAAPRDLAKIFESADYVRWRSFRDSEDSRYATLALPHILMRLPYGPDTEPVEGFNFEEDTAYNGSLGRDHAKYLWGNAAFALGQRITTAFSQHGWTAAIRGVEGGGKVEGLPAHVFTTDEGDRALKCPTEIAITDRREKELNDLGFISLVHCKNTDYAAFFGGQTANKAKKYDLPTATANAQLSAMLPYMLNTSRFAHYIKVMMRDKIGSFMTKENVQSYLNQWISGYVLAKDDAGQSLKAQYPLREARIDVADIPGRPGCYNAIVFLRPHFQLEELTASLRLVAELPPPAA